MTVYFRLLAGFTSFISKRCLSHFRSIGPPGTREFSSIIESTPAIDRDGNHGEAEPDEERERPARSCDGADAARAG